MNHQALGQFIRELREKKEFSLREFASKLDLSPAFISDIELGRRYPSEDILEKMAALLGQKMSTLLNYDPRPVIEEIKKQTAQDPELGFLMRSTLKNDKDFDDLKNYLRKQK